MEPLDIKTQIDDLRRLKNGWLNGKGIAPTGLDWLLSFFDKYFPVSLPLPHLYPTAEGGVQIEWTTGNYDLSIEFDFETRSAQWYELNLENDEKVYLAIDLTSDKEINEFMIKLQKRLTVH